MRSGPRASGTCRLQLVSRQARSNPRPQASHLPWRRIHFYRFRLNDFRSFNFLSKVLFIFPSQYLFAIGFLLIFSLRRSLSPAWCTSIKVHDSLGPSRTREDTTDGALTLFGGPLVDTSAAPHRHDNDSSDYNSPYSRTEITSVGSSRFRRPY